MPLTRRRLLTGAAALVAMAGSAATAAACTRSPSRPSPSGATSSGTAAGITSTPSGTAPAPSPSVARPDPQLADLADEVALLVAYDDVLARFPATRAALAPLRADHAAHVRALRRLVGAPAARRITTPAVPSAGGRAAAITALAGRERAAAVARRASCVTADSTRAATLGSIAASEASHTAILPGLRL